MLSIDDDIPRSCFGNASDSRSSTHLGARIMRQAHTKLGEHPLHETRAIPAGRSIASSHIRIALELQSIVGQCLTSGTRRSRRNADVGTFGRTAGSLSSSLRLRLCLFLSRLSLSFSLSLLLSLLILFRLRLGLGNIQAFDATPIGVGLNIRGCVLGEEITLGVVVFGKERVAVTVVPATALPALAAGTAAPNMADTVTTAKILVKRLTILIVSEVTINIPLQ